MFVMNLCVSSLLVNNAPLKQLTRQQKIQRGYASSWNIVLLEIYNLRMQVLLECCYIRMGNLNRKVEGISSHLSFDFDLPSSSVKVKVKVWSTNLIWVDTIQKNHQTIRLERNLKKLRLKNWTIFFLYLSGWIPTYMNIGVNRLKGEHN